ncbi:P-loop containing nucleoside triphosphate hydrolase protein [Stipitochalara longipes BDJ]|nr:P-loop containing nucleoside triphosphate hydrolase protein [Stipitochalara longipes BDJ]
MASECRLFEEVEFEQKLRDLAAAFKKRYGNLLSYDVEDKSKEVQGTKLLEFDIVTDIVPVLQEAQRTGKKTLIEGANAAMLDIDYGTYPFVMSSSTGTGGAISGLALNPFGIADIKTTISWQAHRNLASQQAGVAAVAGLIWLWFGLQRPSTTSQIKHEHKIKLAKLDVLDTFETIKVATSYEIDGRPLKSFPANLADLSKVAVRYKTLPGWRKSIKGITNYHKLPLDCRNYVEFVERDVGVKIAWIGTGLDRDDMIAR